MNLIQKIILLSCLIFFIHPTSGYEPIPIIGYYYESSEEVNIHLGDDTDPGLTPSDPDTLSYVKTFSLFSELRRQQIRLVLTVINVLPQAAKEEDEYNDLVYINGISIGRLNDHIGGTEQDYNHQQVELIFSSDLIHKGENTLTVTSGANPDRTNYDDFVIQSIYMEQYGGLKHWLFSHISPDYVIFILAALFMILAGSGYYLNRINRLPSRYQFPLWMLLGAILGIILTVKNQDSLVGLIILFGLVGGIMIFILGIAILAAGKYILHKNIQPVWFISLTRLLIFLVLVIIFFIFSQPFFYFDPGGPKPTYGVPPYRPEE